jgi:hypothetical protein
MLRLSNSSILIVGFWVVMGRGLVMITNILERINGTTYNTT